MIVDGICFINHRLNEVCDYLSAAVSKIKQADIITFSVMSPDLNPQLFNGETAEHHDIKYIHRSLKCWMDLAETLNCRMLMPENLSDGLVKIRFQKLSEIGWHSKENSDVTEKYGRRSLFFRLDKSEEASFLYDFTTSITNLDLFSGCKVLNLGCHSGTEFKMLHDIDSKIFHYANFTGIDHSKTAIDQARNDFPESRFITGDANKLTDLINQRFDLIISIGTLQSPGIDAKKLFMQLVQDYLNPNGAILIGQPNCRYLESEIKYGAVTKNRQNGELGLVISDLFFYKKYLQQHKFETFLRGKYYLFLAGKMKNK